MKIFLSQPNTRMEKYFSGNPWFDEEQPTNFKWILFKEYLGEVIYGTNASGCISYDNFNVVLTLVVLWSLASIHCAQ